MKKTPSIHYRVYTKLNQSVHRSTVQVKHRAHTPQPIWHHLWMEQNHFSSRFFDIGSGHLIVFVSAIALLASLPWTSFWGKNIHFHRIVLHMQTLIQHLSMRVSHKHDLFVQTLSVCDPVTQWPSIDAWLNRHWDIVEYLFSLDGFRLWMFKHNSWLHCNAISICMGNRAKHWGNIVGHNWVDRCRPRALQKLHDSAQSLDQGWGYLIL